MLNEVEIEKQREAFFKSAKDFGLDVSSSSMTLPLLDFVFKQKILNLNEINAISENYNIERAKGLFLEMEAFKIGLSRGRSEKALLKTKLNIKGSGYLREGVTFESSGLRYTAVESVYFETSEGKEYFLNLIATEDGAKFNLNENITLFTNENVLNLVSLEVVKLLKEGKNEENDSDFRKRILKTIPTFTIRDSKSYYEGKLTSREEIREAYVIRTPRGANSMDIVLRALNQDDPIKDLEIIAREEVEAELPAFVDIKFLKAMPEEVEITLVKLNEGISEDEKKRDLEIYFRNLKLGDTFSLFAMYEILGQNINIIKPVKDKTTEKTKFFLPVVKFEV